MRTIPEKESLTIEFKSDRSGYSDADLVDESEKDGRVSPHQPWQRRMLRDVILYVIQLKVKSKHPRRGAFIPDVPCQGQSKSAILYSCSLICSPRLMAKPDGETIIVATEEGVFVTLSP